MSTSPVQPAPVAYEHAALRHLADAEILFHQGRLANAGQLYGFVAECGLKAMLLACGVTPGADGGIPGKHPTKLGTKHPLREHMPSLTGRIAAHGQLIPDGQQATSYMATMVSLGHYNDWSVDHRYWLDAALPLASVAKWRGAAQEVCTMLDQVKQNGVL
ncbi:MAG: hypothetical protein RLZZ618_1517 [Pseudomonadota bacterium]|jgi:hypothetical protein